MGERAITLLHLSDPQLGPHHRFAPEGDGSRDSLVDRLAADRVWIDAAGRPDLVLITGDLAELGKRSELEDVYKLASGLARLLEIPARNIVLVPGNHDINWNKCEAYFKNCEGDEVAPKPPYWPKLEPYAELFARFYEGQSGIRFDEKEPWSFYEYPELKVVVAGMNSTMAESHRAEDHYGFLGEAQLEDFVQKLRPYKEQGWLRIGAMHHDPLSPEGSRAEQDSEAFRRILAPYLNLVLHGHIHKDRVGWCDGGKSARVPVLGIGSTGVKAAQRAPDIGNQYQIVRVSRNGLRCEARRYDAEQRRWVGDQRIDPSGSRAFVEWEVVFERVEATFGAEPALERPGRAGDLAGAVERYRQHVVLQRQTTLYELMSFGEDRRIDFLDIFVVPNVRPSPPAREPWRERPNPMEEDAPVREPMLDDRLAGLPLHEGPVQPADRVLAGKADPWILLLGAPGSGKTAITRWLMLGLCEPGARIEGLADDLVPVRIELRRFDGEHCRTSRKPYDFFVHLDELHAESSLGLRDDALRELARLGRLFWIFDGLDEVPDPNHRRRIAEMIAGLKAAYPACRGLVTSRIAGVAGADGLLHAAGFGIYTLLDLEEIQADTLLDRWHAAVFAGAPEIGERRRERLAIALRDVPALRRLCGSPLLATMVAYLSREEELPRRRHQVYQKVIERMADQWDAAKDLPVGPGQRRFPLSDKLRFLRQLAWQMLNEPEGQANAIHEEILLRFAARFCEEAYDEAPDVARSTAEQLVQHLRERNHVVTLLGGRLFGFVHKTFLEHLAAAEVHARLRKERDLSPVCDIFRRRWQNEAWQETLSLLCGLLDEDRPGDVIAVLQGILVKPGYQWQLALKPNPYIAFVIRCLAEVERLDRDPARTFIARLMDLLEHCLEDTPPLAWRELVPVFRLHTGRWPEFDRLYSLAIIKAPSIHAANGAVDFDIDDRYQCLIAAGGKSRRLALLLNGISTVTGAESETGISSPYLLGLEGAALGSWTEEEVCAIVAAVAHKDNLTRLNVLANILSVETLKLPSGPGLVFGLEELARPSVNDDIRYRAAWLLVKHDQKVELGKSVLLEILHTGTGWLRGKVVEALDELGMTSDALPAAIEVVPKTTGCLRLLSRLAPTDPMARRALDEAIARVWMIQDDVSFRHAMNQLTWAAVPFDEKSFFERFERMTDPMQKHLVVSYWSHDSRTGPVPLRALEILYDSGPRNDIRGMILRDLSLMKSDNPAIERFILKIMLGDANPSIRIQAAGVLLRSSKDPRVVDQARSLLLPFTLPQVPERTREHAARNLQGERRFTVLSELSRSATDERIRLIAAEDVGNRASLLDLATSAADKEVRRFASHDIGTLQLLHALRQVGRPRKGRVRLDGRPVGVIEETPGGGSRFTYDPEYVNLDTSDRVPISLTLPVRKDPYDSPTLHPFFENLLPEGWLLDQTCAAHAIPRTDAFGLMLATCADCAGAVEILPIEEPPP